MKFVDEFRDKDLALSLQKSIELEVKANIQYRFLEFCGGHTHAIFRHGVQTLMPKNLEFIHGPGCPVCVLPSGRIASIIHLIEQYKNVIVCTYGDVLRVPTKTKNSLQKMRAQGADIRVIYSPLDALRLAETVPNKKVIFFAIGFETTAPATAAVLVSAKDQLITNFFVYCNHVITEAALQALLTVPVAQPLQFNGILGPSHVSTILGSHIYQKYCDTAKMPIVVAGFEPLDVMQSTLMLVRQVNANRHCVENEYTRAVSYDGNTKAQALMDTVFSVKDAFSWRGLGSIPHSGFRLSPDYAEFDAEIVFDMEVVEDGEIKGCKCPEVLRGKLKPKDCKLFGTVCRPDNPMGACMVSSEGACAAHWHYGIQDESVC